jgi:hypothetical protein
LQVLYGSLPEGPDGSCPQVRLDPQGQHNLVSFLSFRTTEPVRNYRVHREESLYRDQKVAGAGGTLEDLSTDLPKSHNERIIEVLRTYMAYDRCRCADLGRQCLKCLAENVIRNR